MELVLRTFPSHRVVAVALISLLPMSMTTFLLQSPGLLHSIHGIFIFKFSFWLCNFTDQPFISPLALSHTYFVFILFLFYLAGDGSAWSAIIFPVFCSPSWNIHTLYPGLLVSFIHFKTKWWCHLRTFSGPNLTSLCLG